VRALDILVDVEFADFCQIVNDSGQTTAAFRIFPILSDALPV
jgi:hypothetical protein